MRRIFGVLTILCALMAAAADDSARYYVVFLRPDPARKPLAQADAERLQAAHMANIRKMASDGILVAAGPFDDRPVTISGIFVFQAASLESARAVAAQDPTVVEHRNTVEVYAWMGPRGIGAEYRRLHQADPSTPENMQPHPLCLVYRGAAWDEKSSQHDELLKGHAAYIEKLREQGKLGAAGAIEPSGGLLGLVVFKPIPLDEVQALLRKDPAIEAGVLRIEPHTWWSSDHVLPW